MHFFHNGGVFFVVEFFAGYDFFDGVFPVDIAGFFVFAAVCGLPYAHFKAGLHFLAGLEGGAVGSHVENVVFRGGIGGYLGEENADNDLLQLVRDVVILKHFLVGISGSDINVG